MSKLDALRRTQASTADSVADAVEATVALPAGEPKTLRSRPVRTESITRRPTLSTSQEVERINVILPLEALEAVDQRIASLGRKKKVSVSGYIEAVLPPAREMSRHSSDIGLLLAVGPQRDGA